MPFAESHKKIIKFAESNTKNPSLRDSANAESWQSIILFCRFCVFLFESQNLNKIRHCEICECKSWQSIKK
ncbi:hypothetical protein [Helicobacter sp. 23-1045]